MQKKTKTIKNPETNETYKLEIEIKLSEQHPSKRVFIATKDDENFILFTKDDEFFDVEPYSLNYHSLFVGGDA